MEDYILNIQAFINDYYYFCVEQIDRRGVWEWMIFFMPFYLFGEFPRYIFPSIYMALGYFFIKEDKTLEQKQAFMETNPSVSVLLVGYNEEDSVAHAIDSLLSLEYNNMEIIVVDDGSEDHMYEIAKPYADKGLIKLFKNTAATGRGGRPTASNLALHMATGDYILSVDADTSFDRNILLHMIGPFYDRKVGVVAGNLKVKNINESIWARFQAIEYAISIGLWKRWLNILGMNMQASGAFGAFRREALKAVGAWDPELAEDADLSLKIKKSGWKIVFAPEAIAMTNVPATRKELTGQRLRWDKGTVRTYFHKHGDLFKFWRYNWKTAIEVSMEYFFSFFLTFLYAIYIIVMATTWPKILIFVWIFCYLLYTLSALLIMSVSLLFSERKKDEWPLLFTVFSFSLYKSYFRWIRFWAMFLETFRINYEENYLPKSAWKNTEKW